MGCCVQSMLSMVCLQASRVTGKAKICGLKITSISVVVSDISLFSMLDGVG